MLIRPQKPVGSAQSNLAKSLQLVHDIEQVTKALSAFNHKRWVGNDTIATSFPAC